MNLEIFYLERKIIKKNNPNLNFIANRCAGLSCYGKIILRFITIEIFHTSLYHVMFSNKKYFWESTTLSGKQLRKPEITQRILRKKATLALSIYASSHGEHCAHRDQCGHVSGHHCGKHIHIGLLPT